MKVHFSLRALLLFVTVIAVCLGWYSYQRERFSRELTAANWLRNERGASLGWFKWDDELPLTADSLSSGWDYEGGTVPAWDRSEWFHGRLHKPVNWCRLDFLLKDGGLQDAEIDARCVEELKQLKYLKHLYIDTTEGHKHVDIPYGNFSNLEYLEVVGDVPLSKREIASIAQMYHLRSLVLEDSQLDDEALSRIGNLHGLRRLNVYSPLISNEGLASIQNLKFLQDLALDGEAITDDGLIHLSNMRSLSRLYLGNTRISGIGFGALKGVPIEILALAKSRIDEEGLATIVKVFPGVRELDLSYTELDNDGIALISTALPQLRELDIKGTNITDACVPDLKKLKSLKLLCVEDTAISEEGLAILDGIKGCKVFPLKFHRPEAAKKRGRAIQRRQGASAKAGGR